MVVAVLLTLVHCTIHAAESFAAQATESHAPDGPAEEAPVPCEQESGCLCRGAVLARAVELPHLLDAGEWTRDFACVAAPNPVLVTSVIGAASTKSGIDGPPPISGKALRAWVSSLLC